MKCPSCDFNSSSYEELVNHLEYSHFLSYGSYYENLMLSKEDPVFCFKCNSEKQPLTWIDKEFYYLPCWNCIKRKSEIEEARDDIIKNIKSFYKKITGDRHFQLFVLDDIYSESTFPHRYSTFKEVLKLLELPKDREDLWFLDWSPGYPKIINRDNINGIKVVNLTGCFKKFINEKGRILVDDYEIVFPEKVPLDSKHYFRYNLLNASSNRKTKRIKLPSLKNTNGDQDCIKLYNTDHNSWKSLFKVYKGSMPVNVNEVSHQDKLILKLAIFRNKTALKLIFETIYELLKGVHNFRDGIFLKNTVLINPSKTIDFNLTWTVEEEKYNEFINISIL